MKPWWASLGLVLSLSPLCAGQSLGDAAKKEHERRDKLGQEAAAAPTIKDEDLASNKGKLANGPTPTPEPAAAGEDHGLAQEQPTLLGIVVQEAPETASPQNGEAYWRDRFGKAQERVERAQRRYDSLQRQIYIGQPAMYNENGQRVIYSIYQMKEKADAAEAELAAAKQAVEDLYTEARHAGALPGWLR